jgi:hypothetical protein
MKRLSIAKTLKAANPVTTNHPLDAQGRVELARYVHPSVLVDNAVRPRRHHSARWALVATGATTALVASAVILWPGHTPPAQAEVITGKVLTVVTPSAGDSGADWASSAITELTAPNGDTGYIRAWSKTGQLTAQEGEVLTYKELPGTQWIASEAETSLLVSTLPSMTLTFSSEADGLTVAASGEASGSDADEGTGGASIFVSGSIEEGGSGIWSVLTERDGEQVFYVVASGKDLAERRAFLEALDLTPDGEWANPGESRDLLSPAGATHQTADGFGDEAPAGGKSLSETEDDGVVSRTEGVD